MVNYFFKVVFHEALRDGKLKIPPKFVKTNGKSLEDSEVILEARVDGEKWEVKLEKHGGKVWFGEGWKEFANHYSIKFGHFVVFKYKENYGHFRVDIFDETCTEIEFGSSMNQRRRRRRKRRKPTHSAAGTSRDTTDETPMPSKVTISQGHNEKLISKRYAGAKADERAKAFRSKNPFFWLIMEQPYAYGRYMNIPKDFVEQYLEDKAMDVIFRNSEGRTWSVRYLYETFRGKANGKFTGPWPKFVEDNNVEVGDVCLFELINSQPGVCFKVHIFRSQSSDDDDDDSSIRN